VTLPLFANGSVVGDYTPLIKYLEEARKRKGEAHVDDVVPRGEDLEYVKKIVESGTVSLAELLQILTNKFYSRVDGEVAKHVLETCRGVSYTEEEARIEIAKLLAGWCIEICSTLGIVKLRPRWKM